MKHGDAGPLSLRGWVGSRGGLCARRARIKRVGAVCGRGTSEQPSCVATEQVRRGAFDGQPDAPLQTEARFRDQDQLRSECGEGARGNCINQLSQLRRRDPRVKRVGGTVLCRRCEHEAPARMSVASG